MPIYNGKLLDSLPHAELEAKEIAALLEGEQTCLIGAEANRECFFDKLTASRIAHLATHGLLNLADGEYMPGRLAL